MNYIVIEFQSDGEHTNILTNSYAHRNEAESKYYTILSVAAVSNVLQHGAFLLDDEGSFVKSDYFKHESNE